MYIYLYYESKVIFYISRLKIITKPLRKQILKDYLGSLKLLYLYLNYLNYK